MMKKRFQKLFNKKCFIPSVIGISLIFNFASQMLANQSFKFGLLHIFVCLAIIGLIHIISHYLNDKTMQFGTPIVVVEHDANDKVRVFERAAYAFVASLVLVFMIVALMLDFGISDQRSVEIWSLRR